MAGLITNYGTLKDAIAEELDRYDLTQYLPRFVQLGEQRIYREVRAEKMQHSFGAVDVTNTISSGTLEVPSDFLELKFMYLNTTPTQPIEQVSLQQLIDAYPTRAASGRPRAVALDSANSATGQSFGRKFRFGPYPDSDYSVLGTYYRQMTLLHTGVDTATPSEFFTDNPELFLSASIVNARGYVDASDQRMHAVLDRHEASYREMKDWLNNYQRREQRSTAMRTRVR